MGPCSNMCNWEQKSGSREQHAGVSRDLISSPVWDIDKPWSGPGTGLNFEVVPGRTSVYGESGVHHLH